MVKFSNGNGDKKIAPQNRGFSFVQIFKIARKLDIFLKDVLE
jgi:hypothetical protein